MNYEDEIYRLKDSLTLNRVHVLGPSRYSCILAKRLPLTQDFGCRPRHRTIPSSSPIALRCAAKTTFESMDDIQIRRAAVAAADDTAAAVVAAVVIAAVAAKAVVAAAPGFPRLRRSRERWSGKTRESSWRERWRWGRRRRRWRRWRKGEEEEVEKRH